MKKIRYKVVHDNDAKDMRVSFIMDSPQVALKYAEAVMRNWDKESDKNIAYISDGVNTVIIKAVKTTIAKKMQ